MVTGNFRLQGVTEIGSTITEYYLSTSSIEPIGGNWSANRPTATRGFYLFMRTVTTLTDGSNFTSEPVCISGEAGSQGAKQRVTSWQENTEYLQGSDGEDWYDIVLYKDHRYLCLISHTSTSKTPQESVADKEGFWVLETRMEFIATRLLLSERIKADQIDADGLTANNVNVSGKVATNFDGVRIEINPEDKAIEMYDEDNVLVGALKLRGYSNSENKRSIPSLKLYQYIKLDGSIYSESTVSLYDSNVSLTNKINGGAHREVVVNHNGLTLYRDGEVVSTLYSRSLGTHIGIMAQGRVDGRSSNVGTYYKTFDNKKLSFSRLGTGEYRITLPDGWFSSSNDIFVILTGLGYAADFPTCPIKATLIDRQLTHIDVMTSNDDTPNDGQFMFQISSLAGWA